MRVLVDTSVWVAHFKQRDNHLVSLLEIGLVVCHPYVVVEVACGTPPARNAVVSMLATLDSIAVAHQAELLSFIERRRLFGRGCGFVDLSLLAAAMLSGQARIWTRDLRLAALADEMDCRYLPHEGAASA
ncbi:MAG: type II toxin-antitoxin system VapC family toxin [Rhodoferax sp.]|jgi:predicted nucleic acid-binding protein|nr:type II toxin-antitoxin system VapC family toxin [Rhodoferax sp.]MCB2043025.1 type II toxin-antitoxin system VapC family toxin [Rhodoferax sp.]MCP5263932.1 type II toxin-antitoxin system VapC family toxin [Rhodoferax sp.]MCW5630366.1 type II toxin-antitoxin system VapC family toxin [Rhodoferax sp.]